MKDGIAAAVAVDGVVVVAVGVVELEEIGGAVV